MKSMIVIFGALLLTLSSCGTDTPPPSPVPIEAASPPPSVPSELPFTRKPRATTFTEASPDTRSHADLVIAACSGQPDAQHPDGWRCAGKKPVTFASASSTPILPVSWTVPNWFVNKSTGSDKNDCITALTACATKQEIWVHRLGCGGTPQMCPRFRQNTILEQDASDTDNTDPLYASVAIENGAYFAVQGGPAATTAATFTRATAKNRAAGTNALLSGSFSAGAPAVGMLVTNTTGGKASRAWIMSSAGGANWNLSQPLAPVTLPIGLFPPPTEIDTWATNDTVTLSTPIAINVVYASATQSDANGSFRNRAFLYNATIFDPLGVDSDGVVLGNQMFVEECALQRSATYTGINDTYLRGAINDIFLGGVSTDNASPPDFFVDPVFLGGTIQSFAAFGSSPAFDGDFVFGVNSFFGNGGQMGLVYIGGNIAINSGRMFWENVSYGATTIYGLAGKSYGAQGASHVSNVTGNSFASTYTAPGALGISGSASACSHTNAAPDVINCGISITPAHLDAAAGVAGFGGNAFLPGGASIANF